MNARTAVILLVAAALTACAVPNGPTQSSGWEDTSDLLPLTDVYLVRSNSGVASRVGRLILDRPTWIAVWDSITSNLGDKRPAPPDIDFNYSVVLLAAAGSTPTQLVSFRITDVHSRPDFLRVMVEVNWPAAACGSVPVVTTPLHVVAVPRVATEAQFTFTDTTTSC